MRNKFRLKRLTRWIVAHDSHHLLSYQILPSTDQGCSRTKGGTCANMIMIKKRKPSSISVLATEYTRIHVVWLELLVVVRARFFMIPIKPRSASEKENAVPMA